MLENLINFFIWLFPIGAVVWILTLILLFIDIFCIAMRKSDIVDKVIMIMFYIWIVLWFIGIAGLAICIVIIFFN